MLLFDISNDLRNPLLMSPQYRSKQKLYKENNDQNE